MLTLYPQQWWKNLTCVCVCVKHLSSDASSASGGRAAHLADWSCRYTLLFSAGSWLDSITKRNRSKSGELPDKNHQRTVIRLWTWGGFWWSYNLAEVISISGSTAVVLKLSHRWGRGGGAAKGKTWRGVGKQHWEKCIHINATFGQVEQTLSLN